MKEHMCVDASLSVRDLAQRCREEISTFRQGVHQRSVWTRELFRRACDNDQDANEAWTLLAHLYQPLLRHWILTSQVGRLVLHWELCDDLTWEAVEKLALVLTPEKLRNFSTLAHLLAYWKTCVRTMLLDRVPIYLGQEVSWETLVNTNDEPIDPERVDEVVEECVVAEQLWHLIRQLTTDDEYVLLVLSFQSGLKPQQIGRLLSQKKTARQVSNTKQNVLARLARNTTLQQWYHQERRESA